MEDIKRFEKFIQEETLNEEIDMTLLEQVPLMINQFTDWLGASKYDSSGILYKNWQVVSGVLGALAVIGGGFIKTYRNFTKEMKEEVNKRIADEIIANPELDTKEIAKNIIEETKESTNSGNKGVWTL